MAPNQHRINAGLLPELEQVVQDVKHRLIGEHQLETEAEVRENIRFETAQISWLERIPTTGSIITVATGHPECELVTGALVFANASTIVLSSETHRTIFFNTQILWVSGLLDKTHVSKRRDIDPYALQLLLNQLVDEQSFNTWLFTSGKSLMGRLIRVFCDSVEIKTELQVVTLKLDQVVAVRSNLGAI